MKNRAKILQSALKNISGLNDLSEWHNEQILKAVDKNIKVLYRVPNIAEFIPSFDQIEGIIYHSILENVCSKEEKEIITFNELQIRYEKEWEFAELCLSKVTALLLLKAGEWMKEK